MPTLIVRYQKEQTVTRLKKVYSTLSQGIKSSQRDNGPFSEWPQGSNISNVQDYFKQYWFPYFNHAVLYSNAQKLGYKNNLGWYGLDGKTSLNWGLLTNTKRVFFAISDGTVIFYPISTTDGHGNPYYYPFALIYTDLNSSKGPNVLGKDIFLFTVDNNTIKPYCYELDMATVNNRCQKSFTGDMNCCTAKIMKDGWTIKDDYPW